MIARASVAALAVAVIVFGGIWLSNRASTLRAEHTLLNRGASHAQLEQGIEDAKAGRTLNPSTEPDLAIYGLLVRLGRGAEARAVFESIVRREPDNRTAWSLLAVSTQSSDPVQFRRALQHLHGLSPFTTRAP
jgi:Flp pilus assembly protein TadD